MTAPSAWALTLLGHSCVVVEAPDRDGRPRRILLDPGNLTPPLDDLAALDAVLITHEHVDHLDPQQVGRLRGRRADAAPEARTGPDEGRAADPATAGGDGTDTMAGPLPVYGPQGVARILGDAGMDNPVPAVGSDMDVAGIPVEVIAVEHEDIYPGLPLPDHLAYFISGRVLAPGDAFLVPAFPVEVLLLAIGAPWLKLAEAIDHVRAVRPRYAVLVHDAGLAPPHRALHRAMIAKLAPEDTEVVVLDPGGRFELPAAAPGAGA